MIARHADNIPRCACGADLISQDERERGACLACLWASREPRTPRLHIVHHEPASSFDPYQREPVAPWEADEREPVERDAHGLRLAVYLALGACALSYFAYRLLAG